MNKGAKYGFTGQVQSLFGVVVSEIVALKDFGHVKKGETGGWIQSEKNLSQFGTSWVAQNCYVVHACRVTGNALLLGKDLSIFDACRLEDNSVLSGDDILAHNDGVARGIAVINGDELILNLDNQVLLDQVSIGLHFHLYADGTVVENMALESPKRIVIASPERVAIGSPQFKPAELLDMARQAASPHLLKTVPAP